MRNTSLAGLFLLLGLSTAYGHGGRLNAYGCHRQTSDNTYHCHSGPLDGRSFASEQQVIAAYTEATVEQDPKPDPGSGPGAP